MKVKRVKVKPKQKLLILGATKNYMVLMDKKTKKFELMGANNNYLNKKGIKLEDMIRLLTQELLMNQELVESCKRLLSITEEVVVEYEKIKTKQFKR